MSLRTAIALGLVSVAAASESMPTVTCTVINDSAGRVYRLHHVDDGWSLGLRHKDLGDRWLELRLPGAQPVFQSGVARLKYRNANGGRQVDLTVGGDGSALEVWVDHGLEVNIEPDMDPHVDLMNTDGPLRALACRVEPLEP